MEDFVKQQLKALDVNMKAFPIGKKTWRKYAYQLAWLDCSMTRCEEPGQLSIILDNQVKARIVVRDGGFELQCVNRGLWWQGCSPIYKRVSSCLEYFIKHYDDLAVIYKLRVRKRAVCKNIK